jgi:hypothetical protein
MKFPFQLSEFPNSDFQLDVDPFLGRNKIYQDGVLLNKLTKEKGKPFEVTSKLGANTLIYLKLNAPDIIVPKIMVNGSEVMFVEKLKWWEYVLAWMPLILLFTGGAIGGGIGGATSGLNCVILRKPMSPAKKYALIFFNTIAATAIVFAISALIFPMLK